MSSYNYNIMYKLGTNIVAADTVSCLPLQENPQAPMLGCIIHLIDHLDDTAVDSANICRCTPKDPVLSKVYQGVQSGTNLPLLSVSYKEIRTERQKWGSGDLE